MIYTDELERLKPLAWVLLACLGFWAFVIWNWPAWTFIILAVVTGVGLSLAIGARLNRKVLNQRAEREIDESIRRKRVQEELDDAGRGP